MQEYEENFDSYATKSQTNIIKYSLKEAYGNLSEKELRELTREAVFAPQNRVVSINGRQTNASDLRYELANSIEQSCSSKMSASESLQLEIANNIENINSGTNSVEEYFAWLESTTDILKNMNDGFVSEDDLSVRNKFLETTDQREAELMLCLSLLDGCKHPKADETARNLRYKLQKLREMRSAVKLSTRNQSDVEISRTEYERAIPYYKAFKALQKLPFGYDIAKQQKINLSIDHDDDEDLDEDYNFYDLLLEDVLNEMKKEDDTYIASREYQLAYDIAQERNLLLSDEISEKMKKLTGRKNSFRLKYESLDTDCNGF
ncbi:MAG: hypothetical protein IJF12_01605 [Alphaproteobacteria bacterium]|nr:hypothetical protein [Alphaproteobacteria bacterium]